MLKYPKFLPLLTVTTICFTACNGSNSDEPDDPNKTGESEIYPIEQDLFDTSWRLDENYYLNGRTLNARNIGDILTFSSESFGTYMGINWPAAHTLFINGEKSGAWWGYKDYTLNIQYTPWNASNAGTYSVIYSIGPYLKSISSTKMIFETYWESYGTSERWVYTRVNNTSNSEGENSSYEKPELGIVDYTLNQTSLEAKFRIYNQDKAKVSSVKGYYGKSSASISTSATLSGSLITINLKGLSKGTKYYIKCSATGPAGTTTSDTVIISTLP